MSAQRINHGHGESAEQCDPSVIAGTFESRRPGAACFDRRFCHFKGALGCICAAACAMPGWRAKRRFLLRSSGLAFGYCSADTGLCMVLKVKGERWGFA